VTDLPESENIGEQARLRPRSKWHRPARRWAGRLLLFAFGWLLVRTIAFQGMYIPSNSMSGTLNRGDYILVNKLGYGARVPFFPQWRLPGYGEIHRNDILVFNLPADSSVPVYSRTPYIKRCAALPGDVVQLMAGKLMVNETTATEPAQLTCRFRMELKGSVVAQKFFENYKLENFNWLGGSAYSVCTTRETAMQMKRDAEVFALEEFPLEPREFQQRLYANTTQRKWNGDFYGPLTVPEKGKTIRLNAASAVDYHYVITAHEGNKLLVRNDSVFLNGIYTDVYTFKYNYYFVLGDNRYESTDSRSWGFVPENHVIGKASYLLYSSKNGFSGISGL
jgi:signal peptidase I